MQKFLSTEEGMYLVKLARRAVRAFLTEGKRIRVPKDVPRKLLEKRGVFVTISKYIIDEETDVRRKILRGCVGYPEPIMPLAEATISSAIDAATEDPRFPSLVPSELNQVLFEVSVLSGIAEINVKKPEEYLNVIRLGVDGLILKTNYTSAIVLPQHAVEYGLNVEQYLSYLAAKAGLPPDGWKYPHVRLYRFTAEIYSEIEPNGPIVERRPDLGVRAYRL
ncbi:MAG: TIGR00296 family protein [Thermoprotei archaeon]|nr:MAG: TIGR00296 family protein [Thermoprotei archaeon]RLF20216.1 MAG: TIGR00296 family protein [Thermoprotei archaeon]